MRRWILALLFSLVSQTAPAQQIPFSPPAGQDPANQSRAISRLANAVIPIYRDNDREDRLDNLFRLEMAAGRYAEAAQTIEALRALPYPLDPPQGKARNAQYEMLARAEARHHRDGIPLAEAFATEFRALVRPLDNRTSALVMRLFNGSNTGGLSLLIDQAALHRNVMDLLKKQSGKHAISLTDALALIRAWQIEFSYRTFMPFAAPLVTEDDHRRYFVERNVRVPTPAGAVLCAQIVRPRTTTRLPALLEFTVYGDSLSTISEERRTASNGYIGITGFARGKMCSPDAPVPDEYDGADAAALIDWIARQSWSDGRVGMFGGSYDGFAQWAATKYMPPALKAIMPSVATAPGIDEPMEGGVRLSFNFYWPLYVASGHGLDGAAFEDSARWLRLFHDWYIAGRPYRDLTAMSGVRNPVWDRWISHPDYDAYWQSMIPQGKEFARIGIPVLATTGYYDGAQLGALHYFEQLETHAKGEHYLVIGPYTHLTGQRGTVNVLGDEQDSLPGYKIDPAAKIDMGVLRYQWFDYVFRHAPKPAILKDAVNYEVMDADRWSHAPSLAAMGNQARPFYLSARKDGDSYLLAETAPQRPGEVTQSIDLKDRSDADRIPPGGNILDPVIDTWLSIAFASKPLATATEVTGLFSGTLRFVTNKKDFDFAVQLYELTPAHKYLQLAWYLARASYVQDATRRHLFVPGVVQQLRFTSGRLTAVEFERGSRLVAVLSAIRQPNAEINYGTGKNVQDETIADAKSPLRIDWLNSSVINIPVRER